MAKTSVCTILLFGAFSVSAAESIEPSYVLRAIGVPDELAHCSVRFGLGKWNGEREVDELLDALEQKVRDLRAMSPLGGVQDP